MELDRSVPLLADLSDEELAKVVELADERSYYADDVILRQGEPADGVYVILSGGVRVTAIMSDGTRSKTASLASTKRTVRSTTST